MEKYSFELSNNKVHIVRTIVKPKGNYKRILSINVETLFRLLLQIRHSAIKEEVIIE